MFRVEIKSTQKCYPCQELKGLVPRLQALFPQVEFKVIEEAPDGKTSYPTTTIYELLAGDSAMKTTELIGYQGELKFIKSIDAAVS